MLTGILLQVRIIYLFDFLMNPETTQFDIIQLLFHKLTLVFFFFFLIVVVASIE
jgi:hypothetical protein